ncbi:hypothetical protein ACHQM5_001027 [Ranunculus cassubicifolius]
MTKIENLSQPRNDSIVREKKKGNILSRLLDLNETNPQYLRDIILKYINAGKDTTAATLSWFLYMLVARGKTYTAKEFTSISEFANSVTEEAIEKMQYLHADAKMCLSNDTLPDGFKVCKGDMVAYQSYAMQNFRPERWLDADGDLQSESTFKFTAFQAGPRICLGKDFAYRQMKIFSAIMLVNYRTMITLHIDQGLHLCVFHQWSKLHELQTRCTRSSKLN